MRPSFRHIPGLDFCLEIKIKRWVTTVNWRPGACTMVQNFAGTENKQKTAEKWSGTHTCKGEVGTRVVPLKNCINFPFCGVLSFGGFKPISFLFASPLCFWPPTHIAFLKAFKSSRKELECVFLHSAAECVKLPTQQVVSTMQKNALCLSYNPLYLCLKTTQCLCFYFILAGFK